MKNMMSFIVSIAICISAITAFGQARGVHTANDSSWTKWDVVPWQDTLTGGIADTVLNRLGRCANPWDSVYAKQYWQKMPDGSCVPLGAGAGGNVCAVIVGGNIICVGAVLPCASVETTSVFMVICEGDTFIVDRNDTVVIIDTVYSITTGYDTVIYDTTVVYDSVWVIDTTMWGGCTDYSFWLICDIGYECDTNIVSIDTISGTADSCFWCDSFYNVAIEYIFCNNNGSGCLCEPPLYLNHNKFLFERYDTCGMGYGSSGDVTIEGDYVVHQHHDTTIIQNITQETHMTISEAGLWVQQCNEPLQFLDLSGPPYPTLNILCGEDQNGGGFYVRNPCDTCESTSITDTTYIPIGVACPEIDWEGGLTGTPQPADIDDDFNWSGGWRLLVDISWSCQSCNGVERWVAHAERWCDEWRLNETFLMDSTIYGVGKAIQHDALGWDDSHTFTLLGYGCENSCCGCLANGYWRLSDAYEQMLSCVLWKPGYIAVACTLGTGYCDGCADRDSFDAMITNLGIGDSNVFLNNYRDTMTVYDIIGGHNTSHLFTMLKGCGVDQYNIARWYPDSALYIQHFTGYAGGYSGSGTIIRQQTWEDERFIRIPGIDDCQYSNMQGMFNQRYASMAKFRTPLLRAIRKWTPAEIKSYLGTNYFAFTANDSITLFFVITSDDVIPRAYYYNRGGRVNDALIPLMVQNDTSYTCAGDVYYATVGYDKTGDIRLDFDIISTVTPYLTYGIVVGIVGLPHTLDCQYIYFDPDTALIVNQDCDTCTHEICMDYFICDSFVLDITTQKYTTYLSDTNICFNTCTPETIPDTLTIGANLWYNEPVIAGRACSQQAMPVHNLVSPYHLSMVDTSFADTCGMFAQDDSTIFESDSDIKWIFNDPLATEKNLFLQGGDTLLWYNSAGQNAMSQYTIGETAYVYTPANEFLSIGDRELWIDGKADDIWMASGYEFKIPATDTGVIEMTGDALTLNIIHDNTEYNPLSVLYNRVMTGEIFVSIGAKLYLVDGTLADSMWIYDDGTNSNITAQNPIHISGYFAGSDIWAAATERTAISVPGCVVTGIPIFMLLWDGMAGNVEIDSLYCKIDSLIVVIMGADTSTVNGMRYNWHILPENP